MSSLYESQKAMRQKRRAALQRGVVAILDVGTSKVVCMILQFDPSVQVDAASGMGAIANHGAFRVAGVAKTQSRGVRFGEINSMEESERAIRTAVQGAQKMAGIRVDHVIACFSGARPRSYGLVGKVDLDKGLVADQDIGRVLAACDVPDYGAGREAIHAMPVNFALDQTSGLSDPRGQIGHELAVDMHLLTIDSRSMQNLLICIKRCDLELAGVASSSYASGISALVEDEQELGAACVDIGGGSTAVSVFLRKHMIFADSVRMGGNHITSDISQGLQVPHAMAEKIKALHGGVVATGLDDREMIDTGGDTGDWEIDRRQVSRSELIGVMRPRVEEILEEVRAKLDGAGFNNLPSQRIVLTGGSSQIPGMEGLASRILGQNVRLGRPLRIHGLPQAATGPDFSACIGLSLYAAHPQDECWDFAMPAPCVGGRSFKRAAQWLRENW
ncbi:cell division protein FtsA [Amylibacter kogurei]|uniref:Cell division protein FtsA n=1 Tax=Paramylibacter kogurei TaxID=1889778 RepID=A0A2G5K5S3_9RHOB|nr:cell division protein FtsA [Amylibacter kogurei]PIB24220.1 cell division protein FtsA [Amylibacter kogurei]